MPSASRVWYAGIVLVPKFHLLVCVFADGNLKFLPALASHAGPKALGKEEEEDYKTPPWGLASQLG